jgi:hypothetical protein
MINLALPLLTCIAGLIIYFVAKDPKPTEVGRIMFWVGLLVTLFLQGSAIKLFGG